jgi:hypothetical protein
MMIADLRVPERIARLPKDSKSRPVPYFVWWNPETGQPDFRVIDPKRYAACVKDKRCWVCGQLLGRYRAFLIGPMCAVNRVSSEPPSHRECAEFSARACPFLSTPRMHRNEKDLPDGHDLPGIAFKRNPGVNVVWVCKGYEVFRPPDGKGILFRVGEPQAALWFREGRAATREEALEGIDSGYPLLEELARKDQHPQRSLEYLGDQYAKALLYLPAKEAE